MRRDEDLTTRAFWETSWVFLRGRSCRLSDAKNTNITYKKEEKRSKIIESVLRVPIMVFVPAMERSHSGSVTPSFAKQWE